MRAGGRVMRKLGWVFAFAVGIAAAGGHRGELVQGAEETPAPDETPAPGDDPTPTPTPAPGDPPGPVMTPLPTPVPCSFYGIGAAGDLWKVDAPAHTATLVGNSYLQNTSD